MLSMAEEIVAYVDPKGGQSIKAQREAIERWAKRHDAKVASWFEGERGSGRRRLEQRKPLVEAVSDVAVRQATALVVVRRETLGDDLDAVLVEHVLARAGARLASVTPGKESEDLARLARAFRTYDALLKSTRVRTVHRKLRLNGRRLGEVPWGYRVGKDAQTLVPNPEERRILAIIRLARSEGFKLREIKDLLKKKGIVGRTGRPIGITRIHELLQGPSL
jgi:DNA invertase Pin-like site-specific DNA recombinase